MTQLLSILFLMFSLSSVSWAESRMGREPGPNSKASSASESLILEGWVRSNGTHGKTNCSGVVFEDKISGEITELEDAEKLEALHCTKEQDFLVKIEAEREERFLFWGGDLKLKTFEVIETATSSPHIVEAVSRPARMSGRFER